MEKLQAFEERANEIQKDESAQALFSKFSVKDGFGNTQGGRRRGQATLLLVHDENIQTKKKTYGFLTMLQKITCVETKTSL
jgi:hypothetical protein